MKALAPEFGLAPACRALGVPRSTASRKSASRPRPDLAPLKQAVLALRVTHRLYGVKRMAALLATLGAAPSRRELRRAYLELGILGKPRRKKAPATTDSRHGQRRYPNLVKGVKAERADQVWAADVTCVRAQGKWLFLALVMDVATRFVVGWALGASNDTALTLQALRKGFALGRSPEVHHSDHGGNYAAREYVGLLEARGIQVSMAKKGEPRENAYAERLNRTVKDEEARAARYAGQAHAEAGLKEYLEYYNALRLHTSLGCKTPSQTREALTREDAQ